MEGFGYVFNVFTYIILIDGYCNVNRVDDVFRFLDIMRVRKVVLNDVIYRSLVYGVFYCFGSKKVFELLYVFVEKELVLFKVVCDIILYCLLNEYMVSEVVLFLRECKGKGYFFDSSVFNIIMICLIKKFDFK